ncbi:oxidoreductase, short chain dehydrogenase/reductase family protein, partial [Necator americanus]
LCQNKNEGCEESRSSTNSYYLTSEHQFQEHCLPLSLRMASLMAAKVLSDRVAVVSASTKGIGFAIAKRLGLDGASVVVSSRKQKNVEEAVEALRLEGIDASGLTAHVGLKEDRKRLINFAIDQYGKLDILVSNAAANPHFGDIMSISDSQWDKLLTVNSKIANGAKAFISPVQVRSALQLTQEAAPHLESSGRGCVVLVSSVAGYAPIDGLGAYSVMKSTLIGLNKALSQSLARRNIRVNAIAPGIIRTDFSRALYANEVDHENWLRSIPLNRLGQAEECADAVAFLVSDEASYITGETIGVNGGMHAHI